MIVDLLPTDDQAMIAESVGAFLADRLPVARLRDRQAMGGRAEVAVWDELAALGLFGLGVAADRGGVGYALAEEVLVANLAGRHLASLSVLATMIAAHLGDTAAFASGSRRAAFAVSVGNAEAGARRVQLLDAAAADALILCEAEGSYLFDAGDAGERHDFPGIDEAIDFAWATLQPAQAAAPAPGDSLFRRAQLLAAAYATGVAQAAMATAVEYAKTREQFGQPIGAFQAIKHACAEMARRCEAAYSQVCYVAALAGDGDPASAGTASALLLATGAALDNAKATIQVHGGMGFTEEADAHLYLKRAHVMATFGGGRWAIQRRVLGDAIPA